MKKILYVTGSRAEYGIMKRLLLQLDKEDDIKLTIIATGMHCDEKYGLTYKFIENDGLTIERLINIDIDNSSNGVFLEQWLNAKQNLVITLKIINLMLS